MKKKLLYTVLIILLLANVFLLYMIVTKPQNKDLPQKENFLTKELSFSEDQDNRFLELDKIHRTEMLQIDKELRSLRKQLFSSFGKENFSSDSIANRMGALETAKNKELFDFFKQVREICTEQQTAKFDEIIEKALQKRRSKFPKRGDRGGPPPERKDF